MAAALRCAARRLTGNLIQRQLTGSLIQRPPQQAVPTRFMQCSRQLSGETGDIAVPCATRSLAGSLLERCQTQAAVAEERRRLMPSSLIHFRGLSSKVPGEDVLQAHRVQRLKKLKLCESSVKHKEEEEDNKIHLPKDIQWALMVMAAILFAGCAYVYATFWVTFYCLIFIFFLG